MPTEILDHDDLTRVKVDAVVSTLPELIDWCFTARQHKIGQFVPIYQGVDYWLRRLRIANEEHTKTYSCMRYNEHTHATTNNRYALLA